MTTESLSDPQVALPKRRGRPFEPGNKFGRGRPRGSRNKQSGELLSEHHDAIWRKCLLLALQGNMQAIRLCLEHMPTPKKRLGRIRPLQSPGPSQLAEALQTVLEAVMEGDIAPEDGKRIAELFEGQRQALETVDFDQRLRALEKTAEQQRNAR